MTTALRSRSSTTPSSVIAPTQNPDGREAATRRNHYDFDLNRDWFARTQPETDGKLELLRQYPPALFIDAHEMGGQHYFFPPNKDPIYHEVADTVIDWQDELYGPAIQAEFDRQHIQYFNDDLYDFFALVYGDTVPSVGFGGNGMTFEKYNAAPISERTYEHYVSQWVSLSTGALHRETILRELHQEYVDAYAQGVNGQLEPNFVNDKGSRLLFQVPTDPVRHYFLLDDPAKRPELQALVRRLQRMDVSVYRLSEPLAVPDFKPYGRSARAMTLPAGTYWIPMAQQQKHWIQGMLGEDTYVAFPYFYDISGWSNPLLFNVRGGRSGALLSPPAEVVAPQAEPGAPVPDGRRAEDRRAPHVGLGRGLQSAGWLAYLFDQVWHIPYTRVTAGEIASGALAGLRRADRDPGQPRGCEQRAQASRAPGARHLVERAAAATSAGQAGRCSRAGVGLTTDGFADPHSDVAGALIRVDADTGSPLASGVGDEAYVFYEYDPVIRAADPRHVAAWFPAAGTQDFYVSGFADGEEELGGTAAITDEPAGSGRVVLFASEPNFRALHDGDAEGALERALRRRPVARERREGRLERPRGRRADRGRGRPLGDDRGLRRDPAHRAPGKRCAHATTPSPPRRPLPGRPLEAERRRSWCGIRAATRAGWRYAWVPLSTGRGLRWSRSSFGRGWWRRPRCRGRSGFLPGAPRRGRRAGPSAR